MNKAISTSFMIFLMVIFSSCISSTKITSVAERNRDGQFILKWEVSPDQDGNINIYSSQSDSLIANFSPVRTTRISEQVTIIDPANPHMREFYILKTTNAYSGIITTRIIEMNQIKNFRDLGGYFTRGDSQMRWGRIFRSADLTNATLYDQEKIRRLHIKTIIDFRTLNTAQKCPILLHPSINKISLPVSPLDKDAMDEIMNNTKLTRSDVIRKVQDSYIGIIEQHKEAFATMFDILCKEENYPVLLSGSLGKDRVGIASFLILHALGIPNHVIVDDYMLSEKFLDAKKIEEGVEKQPEYFQEAVTALLSVNLSYINYTIDYINQKYGSVDNYLEKELHLTNSKRNLLRKYLLYNQ